MSVNVKPVYKKQGSELSEEAQYKAKLKSGVFKQPSSATVGINKEKNEVANAAVLAAKSDLTIDPYKRQLSKDATKAALSAKADLGSIPTRDSVSQSIKQKSGSFYSSAAVSANAQSEQSHITPSKSGSSKYSGTSMAYSSAKSLASNASTSTSTLSPPGSLPSSPRAKDSFGAINYEKLQSRAKQIATNSISERTDPGSKDVTRHGISMNDSSPITGSHGAIAALGSMNNKNATMSMTSNTSTPTMTTSSIDIGKLSLKASENAQNTLEQSQQQHHIHRHEGISLKAMTDPRVLSLAKLNADKTLDSISKHTQDNYLFMNPEMNDAAMKLALQRKEERDSQDKHIGEYNLGNGLYMKVDDVDQIARKFVNPVLEDIDVKVQEQRKIDEEYNKEQERLKQEMLQHKLEVKKAKQETKEKLDAEKKQRKGEINEEKEAFIAKKKELEDVKKKELETQEQILKNLQSKHELTLAKIEQEKKTENEKAYKELSEFKRSKQAELDKLNTEFFASIEPILNKLKKEQQNHDRLVEERETLEKIYETDKQNLENAEKLQEKSGTQLRRIELEMEKAELALEKAESDAEKIAAQAEIDLLRKDLEMSISKEKENQLLMQKAYSEVEKSNQEYVKKTKEVELKEEAVKALEKEKEYAELTDNKSVNKERIALLEEEVKELDRRQEVYKRTEERRKFEAAIKEQEEVIKKLEMEKSELAAKGSAIAQELKASDEKYKELHGKFIEMSDEEESDSETENETIDDEAIDDEEYDIVDSSEVPEEAEHVSGVAATGESSVEKVKSPESGTTEVSGVGKESGKRSRRPSLINRLRGNSVGAEEGSGKRKSFTLPTFLKKTTSGGTGYKISNPTEVVSSKKSTSISSSSVSSTELVEETESNAEVQTENENDNEIAEENDKSSKLFDREKRSSAFMESL